MKTYKDTLDYLFNRLPVYQRSGKAAYKPGIGNIVELCEILDNPHQKFPSIHLAGTNGKGSCSHMLASIFQERGFKVGLYTSPHLVDFRERVKINGKEISQQTVIDFVSDYKQPFEALDVSFFEWTVALAFYSFAKENVDIGIIETGLGGRLDSTNIIQPELSIITNIGFDHVQFLGNTLDKIAFEKAGIIKNNTPIVIGETVPETKPVFVNKAKECNAPISFAKNYPTTLKSDLIGNYQEQNIQTVVHACSVIKEQFQLTDSNIKNGLLNVKKNTNFRGRFDVLQNNPKVILDCAHNKMGIENFIKEASNHSSGKVHLIYGTVNDKNLTGLTESFPKNALTYLTEPQIPRKLPVEDLKKKLDIKAETFSQVKDAYLSALSNANKEDLILIFGSTFLIADLYAYLDA